MSTLPLPPGLTTDGLQPTLGGSPTPAGEHAHTVPTNVYWLSDVAPLCVHIADGNSSFYHSLYNLTEFIEPKPFLKFHFKRNIEKLTHRT